MQAAGNKSFISPLSTVDDPSDEPTQLKNMVPPRKSEGSKVCESEGSLVGRGGRVGKSAGL